MLTQEHIPLVATADIASVYSNVVSAKERYARIVQAFTEKFGEAPQFICRSPGRVNLIGEHIDYSGFSVCPMAIERDMVIAVGTKEAAFSTIANSDPKYKAREFITGPGIEIDATIHEWSNYFLCGYKGLADKLKLDSMKPMQVMCDGAVPAGGGLSSSSAFVCCSAIATHQANNGNLSKGGLTEAAINGEQFAGVQIGGMDQSISIMAHSGSALLIDFYPSLAANPVVIPQASRAVFVIANTLVVADKHMTAPTNYNLRVVEIRMAAALIWKRLTGKSPLKIVTLRETQDLIANETAKTALDCLDVLLKVTDEVFKTEKYQLCEIAEALDMTQEEIFDMFIGSMIIRSDGFSLYSRTKHVYQEAQRVLRFRDTCLENPNSDVSVQLGNLMNESHLSCKELFECSCPELDELRQIALSAGALGSRLTGAGWGGCTVSIVKEDNLEHFIQTVKEKYYAVKFPNNHSLNDAIFSSRPCLGAAIWY